GRVDFIKLDVEGAELHVVRGLLETLATHQPIVAIEVYRDWTRDFGYEPADLIRLLQEAGYDWLVSLNERPRSVRPAEIAALAATSSLNLLCAVKAVHTERLRGID